MYRPELGEQFDDFGVQNRAARLGMWLFLGSEVLLFAGLFALYAAYRVMYGADFLAGINHNDLVLGSVNTVVLISSSFSVAMAVQSARAGKPDRIGPLLLFTLVCAVAFLVIKGIEYAHHFDQGIYPGSWYAFDELDTYGARTFFTVYYFMTGLHALHVVIGMGVLFYLYLVHRKRPFNAEHYVPLDLGGLYWHLVDVVWIFLWPMLYLTR